MNMGWVFGIFGGLLALGIALPGLLLAWALLLPAAVERAEQRLAQYPGRCIALGVAILLLALPLFGVLFNLPGLAQLAGWLLLSFMLALASIGAAGLSALMGRRIGPPGDQRPGAGPLLRGALALELAAIFPLIGWFMVLPLASLATLGAASMALLRRAPLPAPVEVAHGAQPS